MDKYKKIKTQVCVFFLFKNITFILEKGIYKKCLP